MNEKKKNVALLFGGRSVEHEISVITALQAAEALDTHRYNLILVYLAPTGRWYSGEQLLDRSLYRTFNGDDCVAAGGVKEITILPHPHVQGLMDINNGKIIPVDVCLLAFHGEYGEDGCIQGLLELAEIPYTGCPITASALAMNKGHCKAVFKNADISVLPWEIIRRSDTQQAIEEMVDKVRCKKGLEMFPLFVKPCHLGSSIGISRVNDETSLATALAKVFQYDTEAIVEPCVKNLMEINISCLEGKEVSTSVVEVPVANDGVLSYEDKYMRQGSKMGDSAGMASLTRVIDPLDLEKSIKEQVTCYAKRGYELLGCKGVVRFDFLYDLDERALYFNELNPLPGSFAYYLWEKTKDNNAPNMLYTHVLDRLINGAIERYREKISLERNIGFHALT